uniref:Uncharacterized protein n=1 Tax=Romanomermis culicivorax TaxID=13658 RepID=A0A915KKN4_ROMCU
HFTTAQQTTVTELYPTTSTEKRTPNFSTVKQTKSIDRASSSSISSLIQGEVISDKTGVGATGRSIDRKSWKFDMQAMHNFLYVTVVAGDEDSPLAKTTTIGNNLAFEKNPNDQG